MTFDMFENEERALMLRQILAHDEGAPDLDQKQALIAMIRSEGEEASADLDARFVNENARLAHAVRKLRRLNHELGAKLEKLLAPPWHLAHYLGPAGDERPEAVLVADGAMRRVVNAAEEVPRDELQVGDLLYLGENRNAVVGRATPGLAVGSELAVFKRRLPDGRLIVSVRDEEHVVLPSAALAGTDLAEGDQVRWTRDAGLAFETIEKPDGASLFLEDTPAETFDDVGGHGELIDDLKRAVLLRMEHPEKVDKYGLAMLGGMIMKGLPGMGKTMIAKALANWMATLSRTGRCRFMNIKPSALHTKWFGESEANYREAFRVARAAGVEDPLTPTVMFMDELDTCGARRGTYLSSANDHVLGALLAELDGLAARGNILVIGATNRFDILDEGLTRPGRLGDKVVEVPRPDRAAAREIFAKHVPAQVPVAGEDGSADPRAELIATVVDRIYAPNGLGPVANVVLRDGAVRPVGLRDLISGAVIAKICRAALERACVRELETGAEGVRREDFMAAVHDEMEQAGGALAVANCRSYLTDLPRDAQVAEVEPVTRAAERAYTLLASA